MSKFPDEQVPLRRSAAVQRGGPRLPRGGTNPGRLRSPLRGTTAGGSAGPGRGVVVCSVVAVPGQVGGRGPSRGRCRPARAPSRMRGCEGT